MAIIKLENVSKYYKSAETVSIGMQKINLEFNIGEFVAITGESGSGKSTLLNVISGLDSYEEGEFYLFGEETSHYIITDWEAYRSAYVGFVFQNYNIIDSYTVLQNILLALEIQGYDPLKRKERALELIDQVGLTSHANHKASKLSGGQKQRAVIARALAKDCPIIVADEPTGNLDSKSAEQVIKILHEISQHKLVVVVTHDFDIIEPFATRKIKMHDGEVVEDKKLKNVETNVSYEEPKPKRMNFITLVKFALRNLSSTPKKTFFILMMQMIVMLSFTLIYASVQSAMLNYNYSNQSENINVGETRMLVEKRDGSTLTLADLDYFNSIKEVEAVYEKGLNFYNDVKLYAYNLDDLKIPAYYSYSGYTPDDEYIANFDISGTDAAITLSDKEFTGRMPNAQNEIIIDDPYGDFSIGDRIALMDSRYFYGDEELSDSAYEVFIVTGITKSVHGDDFTEGYIFFSDEFLKSEAVSYVSKDENRYNMVMEPLYYGNPSFSFMYLGNTEFSYIDFNEYIEDGSDIPKMSLFNFDESEPFSTESTIDTQNLLFDVSIYDWYDNVEINKTYTLNDIEIYFDFDTDYDYIYINRAFRDLLEETHENAFADFYMIHSRDAASISVDSQAAGTRVLKRIDTDTYRVFYPANVPTTLTLDVIILGIFYNALLIIFGLFLYSIVHAVSKNTMRSRSKDFAIYRSIGAQQTIVARLVVIEQVLIAFGSIVLTVITINVIAQFVATIKTYLTILTVSNYLYLFTLFILFGAWLGLRFNKRIFKQSVIENINISKEVN